MIYRLNNDNTLPINKPHPPIFHKRNEATANGPRIARYLKKLLALFISENGFSLFFDCGHTILYYAPTIARNNQFATAINIPAIRVFHPDPSQTFTEKASCSELWRNNESSGSINIAPFAAFHILCSR